MNAFLMTTLSLATSCVPAEESIQARIDAAAAKGGGPPRGWSFEDETAELPSRVEILPSKWLPADTKDARFVSRRDTRRARSGKASWYLRSDDTNGINHAFFRDLPVEAGRRYAFRAFYWLDHRGGPVCAWGNYRFLTAEGKPVDGRFRQIRQGDCTPGRWNEAYVSFYVPSNAATASVHLTFGGRQEVWIDDASFGDAPERLPAADAVRIPGAGGLAVYSPLSKAPLRGLPADLPTGDGVVRLDAARNEKEHFQLVVVPASDGRIDVSPRPFVRADGKPCAGGAAVPSWRIRRVEFVPAKGCFNPAMNRMHPDAVTAFAGAEVSPATNLVLLATVRVPESAEPGAYASALALSDGRHVPVSLRVRTFALPQAASLKTFFHALPTWGGYSLFDRRGKEACIADIHGIFGDMRISGNQNVIAQAPLPKWKLKDGRVVVTDWSAVDRHVRDLNARYGFTYFTVPGLRTLGDNGGWYACRARPTVKAPFSNRTVGEGPFETPFGGFFDEPAALDRVIGYLRQFAEHAKSALPDFEFRWYIYDEPCFFTLAELGRIMSRIESARTGVRLMIVASHFSDRLPAPYMAVGGYAPRNIHPIARDCTERFFYQYRATLDDGQYVANRLFPWQVYAAEGDGALLWDVIAYGRTSPWENLTAGYQDAYPVMLYPPRPGLDEGTVPSMRSVLIADGIEDFDYLKLLEAGYEALRPGSGRAAVMKALGDLLPPEDRPLPSPAQVRLVRARLADLIESFRRF